MYDLQETPGCSIPKEGETASPSQRSLCVAFVSAGRWFRRLGWCITDYTIWPTYILNRSQHRILKGKNIMRWSPSASVLACLVVLFAVSQILHWWRQGVRMYRKKIHHFILQYKLPGGSSRIDIRCLLQCHPFTCCNDLQKYIDYNLKN